MERMQDYKQSNLMFEQIYLFSLTCNRILNYWERKKV